jgi:hypothetical protein
VVVEVYANAIAIGVDDDEREARAGSGEELRPRALRWRLAALESGL